VAAHLEPEILVVDEVLAVGDAQFQKKCLGKMEDVSKNEGRTVLFVSHNMGAVRSLCRRSILMSEGMVSAEGLTDKVIDSYLQVDAPAGSVPYRTFAIEEKKRFQLLSARMVNERGEESAVFTCDSPIHVELLIRLAEKETGDYGYMAIQDRKEVTVLVSDSNDAQRNLFDRLSVGMNRLIIEIPRRLLAGGSYSVYLNFTDSHGTSIDSPGKVCFFDVTDILTPRGDRRGGYLSTLLTWKLQKD
jgi:lipopolysaccharide transport system ATP-binding protein